MISDALQVVDLDQADVAAGMALSTEAGWNQTAQDWEHFIANGTAIGFRNDEGRLVASAAALPYGGAFGYVAMVLVTQDYRRRGLATQLVDRCIADLERRGRVPVLDATRDGATVYRKQGFLAQFAFDRWQGVLHREPSVALARPSGNQQDATQIAALDKAAFGADRTALVSDFLARADTVSIVAEQRDGFALIRAGRRAFQAGPVVAKSEAVALGLIESLLASVSGNVFIDVPQAWRRIGARLADRGFTIQRSFTRMALGRAETFGNPARLFAVAGPEFG